MKSVSLFDICNPKQWKTISMDQLTEKGYPVYGANGKIGYYHSYTHEKPTLLITCRGATCGTLNISEPFSYVNGNAMALDDLSCEVDLHYLFYYLLNRNLNDVVSGSAQPQITRTGLGKVKIFLPPLPIQKKIAAVLEKADELRRKREDQIKRLDDLLQATFLDMFGDPNPKGWDKKPVKFFADCIVPGRDKPKSFSGHIPWVTTDMLPKLGFIDIGRNCKGLSLAEISEVNAKIIPKNSVIMTCVGQLGLLAINKEPVVVNQQLHTFQCKREVVPEFLMYALSFETAYMNRMASSTTVPYMNKTICNSIPVIAPPKDKQERFKRFLGKILGQKEKKAKGHSEYENLFNSLMQRAFKGELDLK
jgi:type I restriction enzyme S subunit